MPTCRGGQQVFVPPGPFPTPLGPVPQYTTILLPGREAQELALCATEPLLEKGLQDVSTL